MELILIGNKNICNLKLPTKIEGSFSLKDPNTNNDLLYIDAIDNKWNIFSVSEVQIKILGNNDNNLNSMDINNGNMYHIIYKDYQYILYCSNIYDNTNKLFTFENNIELTIGSNDENNIIYKNLCINKSHFQLNYIDNIWKLKIYPKSFVYVNNNLINEEEKILNNGDKIYTFGLRIIVMNNLIIINNPLNKVIINNNNLKLMEINEDGIIDDEVKEEELYNDNDYFFKTPRLRRFIETYRLSISKPPSEQNQEDMPLLLTLGPMITMALISVVTSINTVTRLVSGETTLAKSWTSLITPALTLTTSLLWPNLSKKWQKRNRAKKEKKRQEKYRAYLDDKKQEILNEGINQSAILKENLIPLNSCYDIIINKNRILWERKISQKDFLTVRVGIGDMPVDMEINYNDDEFEIEKDILKEEANAMINEAKIIHQVPVSYSFFDKKATAIMGTYKIKSFINNMLLQIISFHSYDELKIVILTDEDKKNNWEIYKELPHIFNNRKDFRYFAANDEEYKMVSAKLEEEFINRATSKNSDIIENEDENETYSPYYLIITDNYMKIRKLGICEKVFDLDEDYGFSFVIIEDKLAHLPSKCVDFITLDSQFCGILHNEVDKYEHQQFNNEISDEFDMKKCIDVLSNIPIEFEEDLRYLPESLSFLNMYKVGKIEQLNILNRWKLNDPTKSLRAPVGINDEQNIIYLDLHEKYHGPHGLIAGTTGSGKSEFIITYILSMCINYSPNEVSFILIDYKGGGLAGAFENKKNNIRLPHLSGVITNLDKNELNRTLVSIQSELSRRQQKFNEVRDELGESTIDIYKYQKFFREGKINEPMPHLFIICDEFAELKSQQPEFMDNLISAARIGRSLGVHLILATQKPSGVVNDQIWSNTKFRVCLKVAEKGDSNEVIKCPDAAEIKNAGRFYLQVGYNEIFTLGQSGWAGATYEPSDAVKQEYDRSVYFIDNTGNIIKSMSDDSNKKKTRAIGDELTNILKYISTLAKKEQVYAKNLWLDSIPSEIMLDDIINKYHFTPNCIEAVIGEYDDPSNQYQNILTLPINEEANTIVYGLSGNARELFLKTVLYSCTKLYKSEYINFYIFDFGSESFKIFSKFPHVGDVVFSSETDKIEKLFKMLNNEVEDRKKLFADYNGDYSNYCKNSGNKIPLYVIMINNLDSFKESYPSYDDTLLKLSREGKRYGIIFILTATSQSGLYSRFLKNYNNQFVLDMNSKDEYADILGKIGNVYPADFVGRGLFKKEDTYEFQIAKICENDDDITNFVKEQAEILNKSNTFKAKTIPVLPDIITVDMVLSNENNIKSIPVGIEKDSLKTSVYNFKNDNATIISSNSIDNCHNFLINTYNEFKRVGNIFSAFIDLDDSLNLISEYVNSYCNKDYDLYIDQIIKFIDEKIINTNYTFVLSITGIDKFKDKISSEKIDQIKNKIKNTDKCIILFIDTNTKLKKVMFEIWYTDLVTNTNGIWIGNGAGDQGAIKISDYDKKYNVKISNEYAWIFKNGEGKLIKLISGDKNEEQDID